MEYKAIVKRRPSDELQHHKYIKRVKGSNGKWRYYYDVDELKGDVKDKLGYDEKRAMESARVDYGIAKANSNMARSEYERVQNEVSDRYFNNGIPKNEVTSKILDTAYNVENKTRVEPRKKEYDEKHSVAVVKGQDYAKAQEAYMKTPLGKISKVTTTINNGKNKVSALFKKRRS